MSTTRAVSTSQPELAGPGGVHRVAAATSTAEREAATFAESFVSQAPGPAWSVGSQPVHPPAGAGGDGLEPGLRARLGQALGADLRDVRLHTGAEAADLTRRAGAEAVTIGRDVSFAPGRWEPRTRAGLERVAHEVAHVVKHAGTGLALRDGSGQVTSATTLDGLAEADRKRVQVVTNTAVVAPSKEALKELFDKGTTYNVPSDTVVALDAGVPAAQAKGLTNLAADWSTGKDPVLKPNTTFTVELDLTSQGGTKAPYRFTFALPPAGGGKTPQGRIIVEQLGAAKPPLGTTTSPDVKPGQPAPDLVADKMKAASITHTGYKAAEEQALRAAIALVPAAHLATVSGLRFIRQPKDATHPDVAGEYHAKADPGAGVPKDHTIVMYDNAFKGSDVQFVEGGTAASYATRMIVHEIGHAVDAAPLAKAHKALEAATAAVNDASGTFTSADEQKKYDAAVTTESAAKTALKAARSLSGTKSVAKALPKGEKPDPTRITEYEDVIGTAHLGVAFREAVKKDGKDVSKYGEKDWQESYAEAYSLYVTAPTTLRLLRPATHAHLTTSLPR